MKYQQAKVGMVIKTRRAPGHLFTICGKPTGGDDPGVYIEEYPIPARIYWFGQKVFEHFEWVLVGYRKKQDASVSQKTNAAI